MGSDKKFDLDGYSVDENNNVEADGSVTADGGFVGDVTGDVYTSSIVSASISSDLDISSLKNSVVISGATAAGKGVELQANGSGSVTVTGGTFDVQTTSFTGNLTGNLTGQVFGSVATYSADGAIALTTDYAILDGSTATVAGTLADGTTGQRISFKAIDVSNAVTVVPANFRDGTTITFTPANETAVLWFDGTNWNWESGTAAIT